MRVVLSRQSNLDLMAQIVWLEGFSPTTARAAHRAITNSLRTLAEFPKAGRAVGEEREWPIRFGRDGFVVVYMIEADKVIVGRIFHGRQDRKPAS
jgi:plasmid stabilization system protein ParE